MSAAAGGDVSTVVWRSQVIIIYCSDFLNIVHVPAVFYLYLAIDILLSLLLLKFSPNAEHYTCACAVYMWLLGQYRAG
jgi:hypothetical protein